MNERSTAPAAGTLATPRNPRVQWLSPLAYLQHLGRAFLAMGTDLPHGATRDRGLAKARGQREMALKQIFLAECEIYGLDGGEILEALLAEGPIAIEVTEALDAASSPALSTNADATLSPIDRALLEVCS